MSQLKHGHDRNGAESSTHISWRAMRQRCMNSKHASWEYYGGRGIKVCPSWNSFEQFLADMGTRPRGKTLDRIDPDGNYTPANCRWATKKKQANNKRHYNGEAA